jgi:alpha 1,3-glucosidase
MPFTGAYVGGFFGNVTEELLVRWYQVGAWCYPFFREHADSRSSYREPHLYNSTILGMIRNVIHDRYRMLPMWYTAAYLASVTGEPIVKPLWFEFSDVEDLHDCESEVIVANALLVVPEMSNAAWPLTVVKPPGIWYHFGNGTLLVDSVNTTVKLDEIIVYIRGGRIVASWLRVGRSTQETMTSSLVLHIALDQRNEAQGLLYLDDGETYKYIGGEYIKKQFAISGRVLTAKNVDLNTKMPSKFAGTKIQKLIIYGKMGLCVRNLDLKVADDFVFDVEKTSLFVTAIKGALIGIASGVVVRLVIVRRKRVMDMVGFKRAKYEL